MLAWHYGAIGDPSTEKAVSALGRRTREALLGERAARADGRDVRRRRRRIAGDRRAVRMRQDDAAADHVRPASRRARAPCSWTAARSRVPPGGRSRLPGLQPLTLSLARRAPERDVPACSQRLSRTERATRGEAALSEVGLEGVGRASTHGSSRVECSSGSPSHVRSCPARRSSSSTSRSRRWTRSHAPTSRTSCSACTPHVEDRRVSIVHVTHDVDEAVYLADRVLVLTPSPARSLRR